MQSHRSLTVPALAFALLALAGLPAQAQDTKPRAQVKAETADAVRKGDVLATDDSNKKLNEQNPKKYGASGKAAADGKSRAAVKAETAEAVRKGDVLATNDSNKKVADENPKKYGATAKADPKPRAQVKEELNQAKKDGTLTKNAPSGL